MYRKNEEEVSKRWNFEEAVSTLHQNVFNSRLLIYTLNDYTKYTLKDCSCWFLMVEELSTLPKMYTLKVANIVFLINNERPYTRMYAFKIPQVDVKKKTCT